MQQVESRGTWSKCWPVVGRPEGVPWLINVFKLTFWFCFSVRVSVWGWRSIPLEQPIYLHTCNQSPLLCIYIPQFYTQVVFHSFILFTILTLQQSSLSILLELHYTPCFPIPEVNVQLLSLPDCFALCLARLPACLPASVLPAYLPNDSPALSVSISLCLPHSTVLAVLIIQPLHNKPVFAKLRAVCLTPAFWIWN